MPQSLAKIHIHLVYSTKNRDRHIGDNIRPNLHHYMGGILKNRKCYPVEINTEPDHAHILFLLGRDIAVCEIVKNLKTGTTTWLRDEASMNPSFQWQKGYGAFSVSESNVDAVRRYIQNQADHHKHTTFQDEFRKLMRLHGLEIDERYVWD